MEPSLPTPRLRRLLAFNFLTTIGLAAWLLLLLGAAEKKINAAPEEQNRTAVDAPKQSPPPAAQPDTPATARQDTSGKAAAGRDSTGKPGAKQDAAETVATGLSFYDILLMMLLAGGLGGVLCNLRGFFMHFRGGDNKSFPAHLEVPYYTRAFMGAGAGLFVYFVANFLIASITIQYVAMDVPFQGMVSFIALAMLAGFGSLEFFQRMKETALSLFGQKAEKSKWERIEELYALYKKEVLTKEEFEAEKAKILGESGVDDRGAVLPENLKKATKK